MITHEITETYEGGKIGLKEGKSDFVKLENGFIKNPKPYSKAHNRAYPQNVINYDDREVDGKIFEITTFQIGVGIKQLYIQKKGKSKYV